MASDIMLTLLFLAAVLVVYYLAPQGIRWGILLLGSVLFYVSASPQFLLLVLLSALLSFLAGKKIEESQTLRGKRGWLLGCVLPLLGILFCFKYRDFFLEGVGRVLEFCGISGDSFTLRLLLPMGISYYTFKIISYVADIYRGKRKAEQHLGYYLTYVLFFPQILSGPIERSEGFLERLQEGISFDSALFAEGLQRIVLGLFKKMVIANRLAGYVNTIFASPLEYPALAAWLAAFFYALQLYCDFSGYSEIAIGMGNLLGFPGCKNFSCPYFSRGIKEFWSRWHISLSGWLKDYVYISLGGNRVSPFRQKGNVLLTFLASGLWHGENWNFLIWGALHGFWNMFARRKSETDGALRKCGQTLVTFAGVTFTWIFFRSESVSGAFSYLRHMFFDFSLSFAEIQNAILPFTGDNTCAAYVLSAGLFLLLLFLYEWSQVYGKGAFAGKTEKTERFSLSSFWLAVMLFSLLFFGVFGASGFLYAQF